MEFEQVVELIRAVKESDMAEFQIQDRDFQLWMKTSDDSKGKSGDSKTTVALTSKTEESTEKTGITEESRRQVVKSPLVGIFHASALQDAEPFVNLGDIIESGQQLGMIEAMKLMNEVRADYSGKIVDILVQNGQQVQFGQPLFVIEE
ncbi:MAG TPA: acetyl-CoA carboxylase biotin carboxyl carrier protein [Candidatus Pelethocola excrementipullorum]|nr:acetyl-CoA carboxylase biotin carboxyl carrier protein [Candidatus Pelethocola excrementipullorum]